MLKQITIKMRLLLTHSVHADKKLFYICLCSSSFLSFYSLHHSLSLSQSYILSRSLSLRHALSFFSFLLSFVSLSFSLTFSFIFSLSIYLSFSILSLYLLYLSLAGGLVLILTKEPLFTTLTRKIPSGGKKK